MKCSLRTVFKVLPLFFFCCVLNAYDYKISAVAIFRDEAPYLREWIEYHKLVGVEHFYLYNNLSQDNYREVLKPYVDKGVVDLIEWSYTSADWAEWDKLQIAAYRDAVERSRKKTVWLAIIDIDEFVVPVGYKNLTKFLAPYTSKKNIGGVCIPWVFFGTSNIAKIPSDKLMIETLILNGGPAAGGDPSTIWNQGSYKSIVRPDYVDTVVSPHYCYYVSGRGHEMASFQSAQINHYWTRDEDYLYNSKIPRRASWGHGSDSVLGLVAGMNNDTSSGKPILRFVSELRNRMGLNTKKSTSYLQKGKKRS